MSTDFAEIYSHENIDYYIFSNLDQNRVAWMTASYECYISGELSIEDIKLMIDSIEKG